MLPLLGTVFVASVCGSLHCVGMCGPLAVLSSSRNESRAPRWSNVFAYHGSRLTTYSLVGLLAGSVGSGVHETGVLLGIQQLAAQLAGGSMLVIGLLGIIKLLSGTPHSAYLPKFLQTRLASSHAWARRQRPLTKATTIGLLTALLPCGWLYAFVLVAAGTASPLQGAAVMAVFGLGSVPSLALVTIGTNWIGRQFQSTIPWASAILVMAIGIVTLTSRAQIDLRQMKPISEASVPGTLVHHVEQIDQIPLPCCAKTGAAVCKCNDQQP